MSTEKLVKSTSEMLKEPMMLPCFEREWSFIFLDNYSVRKEKKKEKTQ